MFKRTINKTAGGTVAVIRILQVLACIVWFLGMYWQAFQIAADGEWLIAAVVAFVIVPIVSFIIWIVMMYDMSKSFGHGIGITIGLILLPFIFSLGVGFGRFQYRGPAAGPNAVAT